MSRIARLLRYMRPYTAETLASVFLMAVVGAMQAFRVLLIKPIVDNVLSPADSPARVLVFTVPRTGLHAWTCSAGCRRTFTMHGRWWRWRWWPRRF